MTNNWWRFRKILWPSQKEIFKKKSRAESLVARDYSQKWPKFEVYSPLIWGAKGEIFIPAVYLHI